MRKPHSHRNEGGRYLRRAPHYLICVCWRLEGRGIASANVNHSAAISRRIVRASWSFATHVIPKQYVA
jgi:hypothetical protein